MAKGYCLKLQVNERGAWRNVLEFAPGQRKRVRADTVTRAVASNPPRTKSSATYRITRDGRTALAYLEAPYKEWRNA